MFLINETTKIVKTALQPFHFSALEVVESRYHLGVQVPDDGVALYPSRHPCRMTAGIVVDAVRGVDGGLDAPGDGHDVVGQGLA